MHGEFIAIKGLNAHFVHVHLPELIGRDDNLQEVVSGEFITKHEITIAQHLPRGTIPVQPLPSRNIAARLRQVVCLCAGIFTNPLRSPKLAHLKQKNERREPHNQELYTVPNTVNATRWGEHIHGSPGKLISFPVRVGDSGPQNLKIPAVIFFRKITSDVVGTRIVRIWDFTESS